MAEQAEVGKCEETIRRRLPVGSSVSLGRLRQELVGRGVDEGVVMRAVQVLVRRETVQLRNGGSTVFRIGV